MGRKYDKDFLIDEFWRFYHNNNRFPMGKDMKKSNGYPSADAYKTHWGTWTNFLHTLELMGEDGWYKCDEQILIDYYDNTDKDKIIDKLMIKRKWDMIKTKARKMGLKRGKEIQYKNQTFDNEFLINELKRYHIKYNKIPTCAEFDSNKDFPSVKVYMNHFGSWNDALEEAQLKLNLIRKYSKEEIINEVKNFYNKYNRSPNYNELKYSYNIIHSYWDTWHDMLDYLGLPFNREKRISYSKEMGKKILQDLYIQLKRIPKAKDVQELTQYNRNWFLRTFGSFENALIESNLLDKKLTNSTKLKRSIQGLIKIYKNLKCCPYITEYEKYARENNCYDRRTLERKLNMDYNDICMKYLNVANNYSKSKEQLYKELENLKNKLKRVPYAKELKKYGLSSISQYSNTFGIPYGQMIKDFGWDWSFYYHKTDKEVLNDYYNLYKKLGKQLPTAKELREEENTLEYNTYLRRFGSIENVCELLDIEYKQRITSCGKLCYDKANELCRSYAERDITNYFIDNNIIYNKECQYNKFLNNKNDMRRLDWIVLDNNFNKYYVEYFGLWDDRRKINYRSKAKKKIKDLYKKGYGDKCIFIFPWDLKHKCLNEIFENIL